ncbi:SUV3 C-terminal domain-containing protein [Microvirga pakistanensis]|uniref:SUV3 domain-containing protein n=1 Tax=Microvirga pakistanensis TaxID=1682650 RepID=UPI00141BBDFC
MKIATTWLWLAQRYPDVFEDIETVVELRANLNGRIEEKLAVSSVSQHRRPDGKSRRNRRAKPNRQGKKRRSWMDADAGDVEQHRVRGRSS